MTKHDKEENIETIRLRLYQRQSNSSLLCKHVVWAFNFVHSTPRCATFNTKEQPERPFCCTMIIIIIIHRCMVTRHMPMKTY